MSLLIVFLTFIMVVDSLLLMLLILIQLPKKEAGAGIAFGGGATDALFGAGSGNALTKMTKYAASVFLGLALTLSLLNSNQAQSSKRLLDQELLKKANAPSPLVTPPTAGSNASLPLVSSTQAVQMTLPATTATNLVGGTATNAVTPGPSADAAAAKAVAPNQPEAPTPKPPAVTNQTATNAPGASPKP
ncbi:MAG: preprotein translocase subunit SecG [Verrucomicrobia bacterium]|nr:preprotein translocase subunit SecG [Verrucomicrobiota bacterium]